MNIWYTILIIMLFSNIGFIIGIWWRTNDIACNKAGYLNIDHSIPGETHFFADLDMPVEQIQQKMYVMFEVKNVKYIEEVNKNE